MKVEFLKDHKFYLPDCQSFCHNKMKGDVLDLDNEKLVTKWIERGIVKSCEKIAKIEVPSPAKYENKMEDVEIKEEKKPMPKKRRSRKAK